MCLAVAVLWLVSAVRTIHWSAAPYSAVAIQYSVAPIAATHITVYHYISEDMMFIDTELIVSTRA